MKHQNSQHAEPIGNATPEELAELAKIGFPSYFNDEEMERVDRVLARQAVTRRILLALLTQDSKSLIEKFKDSEAKQALLGALDAVGEYRKSLKAQIEMFDSLEARLTVCLAGAESKKY